MTDTTLAEGQPAMSRNPAAIEAVRPSGAACDDDDDLRDHDHARDQGEARDEWEREAAQNDLDALATEINLSFHLATSSRFRAGVFLIEARRRVQEVGGSWTAWCAERIDRSVRDIDRCIRLAESPDPVAAIEEERAGPREGMRRLRQKRKAEGTNVSPVAASAVPPEPPAPATVPKTVRIGRQTIIVADLAPTAQQQIAAAMEMPPRVRKGGHTGYWIFPPAEYAKLNVEFDFTFDPCPIHPDFDGLAVEWGKRNHVNPPFVTADEQQGRGPMAWIKKAIEERDKGNTSVLTFPAYASQTAALLRAGAEIRSLGRIAYLHIETGEPMPWPPETLCFILRPLDDAVVQPNGLIGGHLDQLPLPRTLHLAGPSGMEISIKVPSCCTIEGLLSVLADVHSMIGPET